MFCFVASQLQNVVISMDNTNVGLLSFARVSLQTSLAVSVIRQEKNTNCFKTVHFLVRSKKRGSLFQSRQRSWEQKMIKN